MKSPIHRLSTETKELHEEFVSVLKNGDKISYEDLTNKLGFEVHGGKPYLQAAKKRALNDGVVIDVIRGWGVQRLYDNEKLDSTSRELTSIRRKARIGARKIDAIEDPSRLSNSQQLDMTIKGAMFSMVSASVSKRGEKIIQKVAEASPTMSTLPLSHIAAGFMASAVAISKKP